MRIAINLRARFTSLPSCARAQAFPRRRSRPMGMVPGPVSQIENGKIPRQTLSVPTWSARRNPRRYRQRR